MSRCQEFAAVHPLSSTQDSVPRSTRSGASGSLFEAPGVEAELHWNNWKSQPTFGHAFLTHGEGQKQTSKLLSRATGTGTPQGQWTDNEAAAKHLKEARRSIDEPADIRIPEDMGQVIMPDGSIVPARHARVVPKANGGLKTAYPVVLGPE